MATRDDVSITWVGRKTYVGDIVFVDGLSRCGKFMLAPIVATLDGMEHVQVRWLLEHIPVFHALGHLSSEAAAAMLQTEVELLYYDNLIGRNINFRSSDMTSIWNSRDPGMYYGRTLMPEGDAAVEKAKGIRRTMLFATHDVLCHPKIFFQAFPKLRIVHILRHPVDMVDSWLRKRTEKMASNPRNAMAMICHNGAYLPWAVHGWEHEYDAMSHVDRTIHLIKRMKMMLDETMKNMGERERKQVHLVNFETMVTNPASTLASICEHLETTETLHTAIALERERCPRVLSEDARETKLNRIREEASDASGDLLQSMADEYESGRKELWNIA